MALSETSRGFVLDGEEGEDYRAVLPGGASDVFHILYSSPVRKRRSLVSLSDLRSVWNAYQPEKVIGKNVFDKTESSNMKRDILKSVFVRQVSSLCIILQINCV